MIEIKQFINSIYQSNSYIVSLPHCEEAWLIDAGDAEPIADWLGRHGKHLRGVLLTHTHFDHIYGLNDLNGLYPDLPIYTSPEGKQSLYNDKWNLSRYHNTSFVFQGHNVIELHDGNIVDLWAGRQLQVFKTDGHDWSCLAFRIDHTLFTGDAYIPGLKTVVSFPKSDRRKADLSLLRLSQIADIQTICPGHGGVCPSSETDLWDFSLQ